MPFRFRKPAIVLAVVQAIIIGMHVGTLVAAYGFGRDWLLGLRPLFDVDLERNIPAFFSLAILLIASIQLAMVAWTQPASARPRKPYWLGLAAVFLYLALDEGFEIHERVGYLTGLMLGGGELTRYAWLIPYSVLGVVFAVVYLRFLAQLPRRTRNQFLIAGIIYVCGAFGMEFLGGVYVHFNHTEATLGYDLLSAAEETLEMFGVVWFINALSMVLEKNGAPMQMHRSAASQPEKRSASTSA